MRTDLQAAFAFTAAFTGVVIGGAVGAVVSSWNGMPSNQVMAVQEPIERVLREGRTPEAVAPRVPTAGAGIPRSE